MITKFWIDVRSDPVKLGVFLLTLLALMSLISIAISIALKPKPPAQPQLVPVEPAPQPSSQPAATVTPVSVERPAAVVPADRLKRLELYHELSELGLLAPPPALPTSALGGD